MFDLSSIRMHTFSPHLPGTVDTRKSMGLPSIVTLMRPSCGSRFSAMSSLLRILKREMSAELHPLGQLLHHLEDAVDAEADRDVAFHRLDVDVAAALLDGEPEDRVHQPDDRRVFRGAHQVLLGLGGRLLRVGGELQFPDQVRLQQVDGGRLRRLWRADGGRAGALAGRGGVTSDWATSCG